MGTRGAYGFIVNGIEKITYNHWDSYPTGLGANIAAFIEDTPIEELTIANNIVLVNGYTTPTNKQIKECEQYHNSNVSTGEKEEWYSLLREAQGNLYAFKNGLKFMINNDSFLEDSRCCEWAYIINIDEGVLEVYRGFNKDSNAKGRYAKRNVTSDQDYYGVALIKTIPLNEVKEDMMETIEEEINADGE